MPPVDDIEAIALEARAIFRSLRLNNGYAKFQANIENVYFVFFVRPKRLPKGSRFRALRFIRSRFTRDEIFVLNLLFAEQSEAYLRAILRDRAPKERTEASRKNQTRFRRQQRAFRLADEVYAASDAGLSFDEAVEDSATARKNNLSAEAVRKEIQYLRAEAEKRGFVEPFAASNAAATGLIGAHEISAPKLTVGRMKRRGRPPKK